MESYISKQVFGYLKVILILSLAIGLFYSFLYFVERMHAPYKVKSAMDSHLAEHPDYLGAWVTLYHPTVEECGSTRNIGSCGDTLQLGDCAVSEEMFHWCVDYYDTIIIYNGTLAGRYCVKDRASSKHALIDVWRPVGDSLSASYRGLFVVLKSNPLFPLK